MAPPSPNLDRQKTLEDIVLQRSTLKAGPGGRRTVLRMQWRNLTYLHWPVEAVQVARVLPRGLEPDLHDGAAWVGLIPFEMRSIRAPVGPTVPWLLSFAETNVRTYVRGPDGTPGVYFHSLDVPRLAAVVTARMTYRLPYCWSSMRVHRQQGRIRYRSDRRWPRPAGTRSDVTVSIGPRVEAPTALDDFLSERYSLFADSRRGLLRADVSHGRWPLHEGRVDHLEDSLVRAAGYDVTALPFHVRATPGVDVDVGAPCRFGAGPARSSADPVDRSHRNA